MLGTNFKLQIAQRNVKDICDSIYALHKVFMRHEEVAYMLEHLDEILDEAISELKSEIKEATCNEKRTAKELLNEAIKHKQLSY